MDISAQVRILRSLSFECHCQWKEELEFALSDAADTIESLSAKLQAANMERSADNFGEWISCKDRLPENYQDVLVSGDGIVKQAQFINNVFECEDPDFYAVLDDEKVTGHEETTFKAIAWQPLPEPYHEP